MESKKCKKPVKSFYDSDEEIAWGPPTLREIKSDLKRARRKVNRRLTTHLKLHNVQSSTCEFVKESSESEIVIEENLENVVTAQTSTLGTDGNNSFDTTLDRINAMLEAASTTDEQEKSFDLISDVQFSCNNKSKTEVINQDININKNTAHTVADIIIDSSRDQTELKNEISLSEVEDAIEGNSHGSLQDINFRTSYLSFNEKDIKWANTDHVLTDQKETVHICDKLKTEKFIEDDKYENDLKGSLNAKVFLQSSHKSQFTTPVKKNSSKIPTKTFSNLKWDTPCSKTGSDKFKTPVALGKIKSHSKSKFDLKNIVSPVRMYIKYSPSPVLKQNTHSTKKCKLEVSPKIREQKNKENTMMLPKVMYKPSRNPVVKDENNFQLPVSLGKIIGHTEVIKHDRPPLATTNLSSNETLDGEAELTKCLADDSRSSIHDNNMSILHQKTAFRN